ncbi:uncharacterized protein LOC122532749 [Frieseomelitta varia]|uniref:uncharacterized protein LOC122532749 n=1 Tax=Frieseomelitta varia TaxID=561572 RepID=UPI001CB6AB8D|nr:uncharacterized protein LOC122532749 [Frieseomelitta varia]
MLDNLDSVEWNFIITITDVLKPIKDVIEKMSGETCPTVSQYYPMYFALINILQPQPTATTLVRDMSNSISEALKERFEPIVHSNNLYFNTMLLDPHFKDYLLPTKERHKTNIKCNYFRYLQGNIKLI